MALDVPAAHRSVDEAWRADVLPALDAYIRIPAKSPAYDADWEATGAIARAAALVADWLRDHVPDGAVVRVEALPGRTPVVVADIPAHRCDDPSTVLLYGHLDKQPEMTGWRAELGPWKPVRDGDRLYGRGAADDGYSAFAALTAINAVRRAGGAHARCVILIEASEESGSPDLPAHVQALAGRLGDVSLVVCLDSGCATFDRLWTTTSLRGLLMADLRVDVLHDGIHSGASGAVPSAFRILRRLLSRIEDEETGEIRLAELNVEIPAHRRAEAERTAALLADPARDYPLVDGARLTVAGTPAALLSKTWRPALTVTGFAGLPELADAGNVLVPWVAAHLSIRTPPGVEPSTAERALRDALTKDPPYGARVTLTRVEAGPGWDAPPAAPWLERAVDEASRAAYGHPSASQGEGGAIPFMHMLGAQFPDAQFLVTGVLGPGTNAHGPNEFLHVPYATKLTGCVAHVLDAHASR